MDLERLLADATELIAIPSTADRPEALRQALDLVLQVVGPGFEVQRFSSGGKPSALVRRAGPRPAFRVILNGHLDVVPAPEEQFRARLEGSRLYGRGAQDMKVAALVMARVFRELADELPYPLGLQLVTDEEVGGHDGTAHQLGSGMTGGGVTGGFVIIGEHSGLRVVTESKGLLQVRLRASGTAAHAAYPWLGDNALLRLMGGIDGILGRYPVPAGEVWATTVNVARIETTNRAVNLIPADAAAWLDIRYPPEEAAVNGRTRDEIADHLRGLCGPGIEVSVENLAPPHRADPASADVALLRRAARSVGFSGDLLRKHGAADGRFYSEHGVDAVIFGPGGDGQHGPDEYLDVTTVLPYHDALTAFLRDLA